MRNIVAKATPLLRMKCRSVDISSLEHCNCSFGIVPSGKQRCGSSSSVQSGVVRAWKDAPLSNATAHLDVFLLENKFA